MERIEQMKGKSCKNGVFTTESEFNDEMMDIRKDFITIHGEIVLLKIYSALKFAGLTKILKKYDKRMGGLLHLPFTQLALHQLLFITEPLTRLAHECDENLELLFSLEAEVVESIISPVREHVHPTPAEMANIPSNASSSFGEEKIDDLYRMTLAAIKPIQGLKRASSTYNPCHLHQYLGAKIMIALVL